MIASSSSQLVCIYASLHSPHCLYSLSSTELHLVSLYTKLHFHASSAQTRYRIAHRNASDMNDDTYSNRRSPGNNGNDGEARIVPAKTVKLPVATPCKGKPGSHLALHESISQVIPSRLPSEHLEKAGDVLHTGRVVILRHQILGPRSSMAQHQRLCKGSSIMLSSSTSSSSRDPLDRLRSHSWTKPSSGYASYQLA